MKIQFGYKFPLFLPADRGKHLLSHIPFVYQMPFCSSWRKLRIFYFTVNKMDGRAQFLPDELVDKVVEMGDFSIEDVCNLRLTSKHCNATIVSGCDSFYKNKPWLCATFGEDCLLAFNPLSHNWVSIPRECFSMPEDRIQIFMFPNGHGRSILCYGSNNDLLLSQVDNWKEGSFSWKEIPSPTRPSPYNAEYPIFCVGDAHGETKVMAISWNNDQNSSSYELLDIFNASRWEWELVNHYIRQGPTGENSRIYNRPRPCLVYKEKLYALLHFRRGEFVYIDMRDKTLVGMFSTVTTHFYLDPQQFWLIHGGRHGLLMVGFVCPLEGEEVIGCQDIKKHMTFRVWKLIVEGVPTGGRDVECIEVARMPGEMFKYMMGDQGNHLGCAGLKDLIYVYNKGRWCLVELITKADGCVSSRWRALPSHQHLFPMDGCKTHGCLNLNAYNAKCIMNCPHATQP